MMLNLRQLPVGVGVDDSVREQAYIILQKDINNIRDYKDENRRSFLKNTNKLNVKITKRKLENRSHVIKNKYKLLEWRLKEKSMANDQSTDAERSEKNSREWYGISIINVFIAVIS